MALTTNRLDLARGHEKREVICGRLYENSLSGHNSPMSFPFLPYLHTEEKISLDPSFPIFKLCKCGRIGLVRICEDAPGRGDVFQGKSSSLKAPALPSKLLQTTPRLNGRALEAAGQAGGGHTMAVLQAYQADLLRDLYQGQELSPELPSCATPST